MLDDMTNEQLNNIVMNYGIEQPVITFLRHNENRTYKVVDAKGSSYLLRIHQPLKESMGGLQHTYEGLMEELKMLEVLGSNSMLIVQTPVCSRDGVYITTIEYEGKLIPCSLLTWLEGRDLSKDDAESPEIVKTLGVQLAQLHAFFVQYKSERLDMRQSQGIAYHEQLIQAIARGQKKGLFDPKDVQTVNQTIEAVNTKLEKLQSSSSWGLIHGDLGLGNILVTSQGELSFIDFGFFGPGYYLSDVAMGASMISPVMRDSFLAGYYGCNNPSVNDIVLIEGLMLISIIGYYAFQMDNESVYSWMRERLPKLCANHCIPFLAGEQIFYTL